jgi:hypothetical protein
MTLLLLALTLLWTQIHKHDPAGIWEASTGSRYQIVQNGPDVEVKLVPGSNPKFLHYEVALKNQEEVNTYKGTGTFVAKMEGGKECKFDTEWLFIVVAPDRILGSATGIIADAKTCAIKEKNQLQLDLKKKK